MTTVKIGKIPSTQYFHAHSNSSQLHWSDRVGLFVIACVSLITVSSMLVGF